MSKSAMLCTAVSDQIGWFIDNDCAVTIINPTLPVSDNVNYFIPLNYGAYDVVMTQRVVVVEFTGNPTDVMFNRNDSWDVQWTKLTNLVGVSRMPWEMFSDYASEVYARVVRYLGDTDDDIIFERNLKAFYEGYINSKGYGDLYNDPDFFEAEDI